MTATALQTWACFQTLLYCRCITSLSAQVTHTIARLGEHRVASCIDCKTLRSFANIQVHAEQSNKRCMWDSKATLNRFWEKNQLLLQSTSCRDLSPTSTPTSPFPRKWEGPKERKPGDEVRSFTPTDSKLCKTKPKFSHPYSRRLEGPKRRQFLLLNLRPSSLGNRIVASHRSSLKRHTSTGPQTG